MISSTMRSTTPRSTAVRTATSSSGPSTIERTARSASGLRRTMSSASSARAAPTARLSSSIAAVSLRSSAAPAPRRAAPAARPQMPNGSVTVDSRMPPSRSDPVAQTAHGERAEDVGDALHQGPDPGEDEQRVGLLDEELPARPERQHDHQYAADQAEPPHRVLLALDERADRPPHADREEQEAEDVGHPRERVLRVDEADDAGDDEQHAEDCPQPAQRVGDRGKHELLHARDDEHDPDDDADRRDRRLVELEDGERRDDPRDAEDQLDPPEAGELPRDLCPLGYGDIAHLGRRCRTAHAVLLARLVAVEDTVLRRRELGVVKHTRPVQFVEALEEIGRAPCRERG